MILSQYTANDILSLLFIIFEEDLRHKDMVNEEPNQPSLTFLVYYFRSHSLNLFLTVALKRLIHPSISNTQLSMSLITCCRSYHIDEYIQCFVCFHYWFIIIEMFYEVYFYFDLNLQQIVLESLHVWIINIFYSMFRVRFYLLRGLIYTSAMAVFFYQCPFVL